MLPTAQALTRCPPARRTLAEVVADLAQLKARIERTDHEMGDYWTHLLILIQFNAQIAVDRYQIQSDRDSLRTQVAWMWKQALWASERLESAPQKPPATGGTNGEEVGLTVGPPGGFAGLLT